MICASLGGRDTARLVVASYGLQDFITKPVEPGLYLQLVRRTCWLSDVERKSPLPLVQRSENAEEMIGTSENMRRIFEAIRKVATTNLPVLITGQSGAGRELTALAIHERRSAWRDRPFVIINCAAIPDNLLESELFGTLFLDEIGELPYAVQVKLLRFLQEKTFERIGGRHVFEVDVRIMAATNINLKQAIEHGSFREDLYYMYCSSHRSSWKILASNVKKIQGIYETGGSSHAGLFLAWQCPGAVQQGTACSRHGGRTVPDIGRSRPAR